MPSLEPVPWSAVFPNDHPVEVEIGPGRGEMLLAAAAASPAVNFFAIERAPRAADDITRLAARRALANVRVIAADARCVVARLVQEGSVSAYHIYFPDPWPKRRHARRRLMEADFPAALARTLVPGGTLHLATDLRPLLESFAHRLVAAGLASVPGSTPPPSRPTTAFERKYARAGTHYLRFRRSSGGSKGGSGSLAADC